MSVPSVQISAAGKPMNHSLQGPTSKMMSDVYTSEEHYAKADTDLFLIRLVGYNYG